MNMRKALSIISLVLVIALVITGVVIGITKREEYNYVFTAMNNAIQAIKDGTWTEVEPGGFGDFAGATEEESEAPDIEFVAGTYGGVEFKSPEDVVNYYNTVYNATKAETAEYIAQDGGRPVFYALVGTESLELKPNSLLVDGKANNLINGMVPGILGGVFKGNIVGLPPSANRDPNQDIDENGEPMLTSRVTPEDVINCAVQDNNDGTITLTLVPDTVNLSHKGLDAQGHFFNSLGALDSAVESIGVISWAQGTTQDNVIARYKDGSAEVKVDVASGKIVEAYYHMIVKVDVTHATLAGVVKDKSASLTLYYDNHFPASDEDLMNVRQLTRT